MRIDPGCIYPSKGRHNENMFLPSRPITVSFSVDGVKDLPAEQSSWFLLIKYVITNVDNIPVSDRNMRMLN